MIFSSRKIFRSGAIYRFMNDNNIKQPTDFALLLGGEFISLGHTACFEYPISYLHVDLYVPTWNEKVLFEVVGNNRTEEQLQQDRNRDCFLSCEGFSVYRFDNETIAKYISNQTEKYLLGINAFEIQLKDWMKNGIPIFLSNRNGTNC